MLGKKIAIGTANFGSDYGHFNKTKLSKQKINKILKRCRLSNIDTVDTSSDYFKAEFFLGASGVKELKIISKIYVNEGLIKEQKKFLDKKIKKSLSDLKVKKLYALLFRKPENILDRSKIKIWQHAKNYQKEGIISKIGFTIYDPIELDKAYDILKPDIIQVPYNIFDRRIESSGWMKKLYNEKVEIHCRSIFLQGLLLKNKNQLPEQFKRYKIKWNEYHAWLKKEKVTPLEACLAIAHKKKEISKIVIGVENDLQLKSILETNVRNVKFPKWLKHDNGILIDPRLWKL